MNDVRRMCKICQDNGLWVILPPRAPTAVRGSRLRRHPYWTAKTENAEVKIRSNDPKYVAWSKRYIDRVAQEVADYRSHGADRLLWFRSKMNSAWSPAPPVATATSIRFTKSSNRFRCSPVPLRSRSFSGPGAAAIIRRMSSVAAMASSHQPTTTRPPLRRRFPCLCTRSLHRLVLRLGPAHRHPQRHNSRHHRLDQLTSQLQRLLVLLRFLRWHQLGLQHWLQ